MVQKTIRLCFFFFFFFFGASQPGTRCLCKKFFFSPFVGIWGFTRELSTFWATDARILCVVTIVKMKILKVAKTNFSTQKVLSSYGFLQALEPK